MKISISKRHHYTPRYYLKRFENADGALWRWDREAGAVVSGNNERFGYKNGWNTPRNPPPGYEVDWAEKQIATIDGMAAEVIFEILAGRLPQDIRKLALAVSFMHHNQPRLVRELEACHADQVGSWSEDHWLVTRLHAALNNWQDFVPLHYVVNVIPPDSDARFLTSSNPLIDFDNLPTMLLPLSSRHCLFLSRDPVHAAMKPSSVACTTETIAGINRKTIENAWQYVYSSSSDFSE
jgi:hypothetical protein